MLLFLEIFYDFLCVSNKRAKNGYQYISPNLTFPCDGSVTKWKIGTETKDTEQVYLQIWRPTETDYTRVAETVPGHTLLRGMMRSASGASPVATFSGSPTTLSSSPLVSVIFGKLHEGHYVPLVYAVSSFSMHKPLYVHMYECISPAQSIMVCASKKAR